MAKLNRNRRVTVAGAIAVHAEANKSDPFAAKRIAMTIAKHPAEKVHVADTADRLIAANASRMKRNERADWISATQFQALHSLRSGLTAALKKRAPRKRKPALSMSQFATKADFDAARAAA